MSRIRAIISFFLQALLLVGAALIAGVSGAVLFLTPGLPSVETIRQMHLQTPLRVYTRSGKLIAEFGEKKRTPVSIDAVPPVMINAFLAAEDARFFEHAGVDLKSLSRAFVELASTGSIQSGGSTITMQLAKNFFLSSEKTFIRKGKEVLLAIQLERTLSKHEILELYLNKIYLGNRAYGVVAAAQVYYDKPLRALGIAECAMIAGLPKAPSANNPANNPKRAKERRDWIIGRMLALGMITQEEHDAAIAVPVTRRIYLSQAEVEAHYVAEMARQYAFDLYGESVYESGLRVYTTIDDALQEAANRALRKGVLEYDRRHGYRGPEARVEISGDPEADRIRLLETLAQSRFLPHGGLIAAAVLEAGDTTATFIDGEGNEFTLGFDRMRWARLLNAESRWAVPPPSKATDVVAPGDIVRLEVVGDGQYQFAQKPEVQAALASLDSNTGAVLALVGGFDFEGSKFNRAIQGGRQPGSSFKPLIYTAALAKGMTPATIINDAPLVIEDPWTKQVWRPANHGNEYLGPIRIREALFKSKNLVSIRVLQEIGLPYTLDYLRKFSIDPATLPQALSIALGSVEQSPLQMATAYTVFSNQGYQVAPWWVSRIEDERGKPLYKPEPLAACPPPCERDADTGDIVEVEEADVRAPNTVIDEVLEGEQLPVLTNTMDTVQFRQAERVEESRVLWLMSSMLKDVIRRGTGTRALKLGRTDIAGKTGTTNEQKDAWFAGYNPEVVATVWMGFDNPKSLGAQEYGGTAALPIWIDYMATALEGRPDRDPPPPAGLVTVKIDPATGFLASPGQPDAMFESFQSEHVPDALESPTILPGSTQELAIPEQIF